MTESDRDELKRLFSKSDKRKTGSINPSEVPDILRMAGQNPTNEQVERILEDANAPGTMIDINDLMTIAEKHWKEYAKLEPELRQACLAFDRNDTGIMEFQDLKNVLIKYGDVLDEDDIELLQKTLNAGDNKVIVEEFIKILMPPLNEPKKSKKKANSAKKKAK